MAKTFQEIMAETRRAIREISLEELKTRLESRADFTLVDVREGDEYRAGYIPGALHIPRGHLESKAEGLLHRKDAPVIVYCAGGTRSALAARTLQEMGYSNVESANPGYSQWKDRRYPMEVPRVLTADQRERYSRHLLLPDGVGVTLDARRWPRPEIFSIIQAAGEIEEAEMRRTFNMGLGLVVVVAAQGADSVLSAFRDMGQAADIVGEVVPSDAVDDDRVVFVG